MRDRVSLPRLLGFRLIGFQPVFQSTVSMTLTEGPHVILGGNGLGKTTIMQAVIYGLAGGLSDSIEENRSLRWDHSYFRGRLRATQVDTAAVEIAFGLGAAGFTVRRGFRGSEVTGFKVDDGDWITNSADAGRAFVDALRQYGGYESASDFAFLVHRLLYLNESRRLIAWDTDAQVRILMLLNQDVALEENFRRRRADLKQVDSQKRHIHVALGKARQELTRLLEYDAESDEQDEEESHFNASDHEIAEEGFAELLQQLGQVARRRASMQREAQEAADDLSIVSAEIEGLREQIEQAEASLINAFLKEEERERDLAVHKLVENGICPVCGTRQPELRALAQQHVRAHRCMLCGSEEPHETNPELTTLRSQLAEKIRSQQACEAAYRAVQNQLEALRREEERMQMRVNEVRFSQPIVTLAERGLPQRTRQSLLELQQSLQTQENDLEVQFLQRKVELDRDYEDFRNAIDARLVQLGAAYQAYATQFLGLPCELSERPQGGMVNLSRFVPHFNDAPRDTPESCSEAQRFFLDIAFRMALIDLASTSASEKAMFVCETPETALDMSYIDNVVRMFGRFGDMGHALLFSANIQPNGIAEKLLRLVPADERVSHVLNLLDIGQLSNVHRDSLDALRAVVQQTIGNQ